jgi:hypothetical protein
MKTMVMEINQVEKTITIHFDRLANAKTGDVNDHSQKNKLGLNGMKSVFDAMAEKAKELGYKYIIIGYKREGSSINPGARDPKKIDTGLK